MLWTRRGRTPSPLPWNWPTPISSPCEPPSPHWVHPWVVGGGHLRLGWVIPPLTSSPPISDVRPPPSPPFRLRLAKMRELDVAQGQTGGFWGSICGFEGESLEFWDQFLGFVVSLWELAWISRICGPSLDIGVDLWVLGSISVIWRQSLGFGVDLCEWRQSCGFGDEFLWGFEVKLWVWESITPSLGHPRTQILRGTLGL